MWHCAFVCALCNVVRWPEHVAVSTDCSEGPMFGRLQLMASN